MSSIYNEAIDSLKKTAFECGANCIVGLKVDLDEIAGKGKSMFMVTAVGTAVVLDAIKRKKVESIEYTEALSSDKMHVLRQINYLKQQSIQNSLVLDEKTWEFITEYQVYIIANEVFETTVIKYNDSIDNKDIIYQRLFTYLLGMPENIEPTYYIFS